MNAGMLSCAIYTARIAHSRSSYVSEIRCGCTITRMRIITTKFEFHGKYDEDGRG